MTHALSKGEGGVQRRSLLFPAAGPSTAPRASGTCPAPRGPAEAQRFPHGRAVSARWTKLFGQPAAEKEKEKHILSCRPPAPESKGELGVGLCMGQKVYSRHPEAEEGRRFKWHEKREKRTPSTETTFTPGKFTSMGIKCLLLLTHLILKMENRGKKIK